MNCWILTFSRPAALNRQIAAFGRWTGVKIFSNHPEIQLTSEHADFHKAGDLPILYNSLSDPEATAYTARSWNSMFLKCFKEEDEAIFVQDDTHITNWEAVRDIVLTNKERYDFMWAPAGDQFWYMKKKVLQEVGFFDERFSTGAFCGDADFLKRVWLNYDRNKLSIVEKHDFGFSHNSIGLENYIPTDIHSKAIDSNYQNQHQEIQRLDPRDVWMSYAQEFWKQKWGHPLNGVGPITQFSEPPKFPELFLYPWFTKKYLGIEGIPRWAK